ncbi:MAG: hypothetical protein K0R82_1455 [Flavipsychrobacter sp.]|jgi:hypothetical protein|nr:hypothetical protein [Flavipsychrobacter sp.]
MHCDKKYSGHSFWSIYFRNERMGTGVTGKNLGYETEQN